MNVSGEEKVDFSVEYAHISFENASSDVEDEERRVSVALAKDVIHNLKGQGKTYSLAVLLDDYNEALDIDEGKIFDDLSKLDLPPDYVFRESYLAGELAEYLIGSLQERYMRSEADGRIFFSAETNDQHLWAPVEEPQSFRRLLFEPQEEAISFERKSFRYALLESFSTDKYGRHGVVSDLRQSDLRERTSVVRESYQAKTDIALKYGLEDGTIHYACPLLTTCWHLLRLGVAPFTEEIAHLKPFSDKGFVAESLITILPARFLKVEATALEIMSLSKRKHIRNCRGRLKYFFF